jgi:type II secretory pathway component PulJ
MFKNGMAARKISKGFTLLDIALSLIFLAFISMVIASVPREDARQKEVAARSLQESRLAAAKESAAHETERSAPLGAISADGQAASDLVRSREEIAQLARENTRLSQESAAIQKRLGTELEKSSREAQKLKEDLARESRQKIQASEQLARARAGLAPEALPERSHDEQGFGPFAWAGGLALSVLGVFGAASMRGRSHKKSVDA